MQPLLVHNLIYLVLGAVIGSVANAVIYRLPRGLSWWKGRSVCQGCKHELAWRDLIPIFSWLALRGKCRYCHSPIGIRYLQVELILAIGYWFLAPNYLLMAVLWVTVVTAAIDWETQLVSDLMILLWFLAVVAYKFSIFNFQFSNSLLGVAIAVGLIGGIWAISRGKVMGFGDVEIAVVLGWWLGWPQILVALWVAFVAGGVIGGIRVIRGISGMKSKMAFGPFLILGSWVGYLWGDKIIAYVFRF